MNRTTQNILRHGSLHFAGRRPLNSSTEIRLTRLCTQRCRQCRVYERRTEPATMDLDHFNLLAQRLRDYGAYIGFISGGEATLVPDLDRMLVEAKKTFSIATTLVTGLYHRTDVIREIAQVCLANGINIQTSLDGLGKLGDHLRGVANFSDTVVGHMEMISAMRRKSRSLLYANIVLTSQNLEQVPDLIATARKAGWRSTIGLYHHLTETTREDDELSVKPGAQLDALIEFLLRSPDILNLNSFIRGIGPFLQSGITTRCPFTASRFLSTRTTIMENGDLHLCWGGPVGNAFQQSLQEIFSGNDYLRRLETYDRCHGCWTTCYTQRYLLSHPASLGEWRENLKKMRRMRAGAVKK